MIFRFTTSDSSNQNANNAQPVGGGGRCYKKCVRSAKVNVLEGKWVEWGMSGGKGIANQLTWSRIYPLGAASFRSQFRSSVVPLRFFFLLFPISSLCISATGYLTRCLPVCPFGTVCHHYPAIILAYLSLSGTPSPSALRPRPTAHGPVLSIKC